ncbi:MAG: hypothetical protein BWY45_02300 [Euryarchaeota archaeon ADurb.Bin294]|nr:MAG: hypothetical protein BWY45_02300 [Euryarchaeota archaeon ADurb.Bin294]
MHLFMVSGFSDKPDDLGKLHIQEPVVLVRRNERLLLQPNPGTDIPVRGRGYQIMVHDRSDFLFCYNI